MTKEKRKADKQLSPLSLIKRSKNVGVPPTNNLFNVKIQGFNNLFNVKIQGKAEISINFHVQEFLNTWIMKWGKTPFGLLFKDNCCMKPIILFIDQRNVVKMTCDSQCLNLRSLPEKWYRKENLKWWLEEEKRKGVLDMLICPKDLYQIMMENNLDDIYIFQPNHEKLVDLCTFEENILTCINPNNESRLKLNIQGKNEKKKDEIYKKLFKPFLTNGYFYSNTIIKNRKEKWSQTVMNQLQ